MIWIGMLIGAIIGFGIAVLIVANEREDYTRLIRDISLINFAERLKAKAEKCEPWEEPCFFASDIDAVLKEMVGDTK